MARAATLLLLETWRPHPALRAPPPRSEGGRGEGGNLQFFSLWENTLNLTTCSGCNVPVKLAKKREREREEKQKGRKKERKTEVRCALEHRQPKQHLRQKKNKKAKDSWVFFSCGRAVFCALRVSRRRGSIARSPRTSLPVEPCEPCHPDGALCFQH